MKKFSIVLDEKRSYLVESESGKSFSEACDHVIDYGVDSNLNMAYEWLGIKQAGEEAYTDFV